MKRLSLLATMVLIAAFAYGQSSEAPVAPLGTDIPVSAPTPLYVDNVRPLSGVQNYDLGIRTDRLNVLTPSFTFSEAYGTNPGLSLGSQADTVWGSTTTLGGALEMARGSAKRLFSMAYFGSAQVSSYDSNLNTQIHSFDMMQSIKAGRWDFVFGDTLKYQPNAYGASAPLLFAGTNVVPESGIRPELTPNDSILTHQATQLTSTAVGQVSYGLSRASVLTGSASYGILRFLDGTLLDSQQFNATGGFDHKIGHNTVGVGYTFTKFMYDDVSSNFNTNTVQLTYARRLIGRMTFAAGAGPTFTRTTTGSITDTKVDVAARASFQYAGNRTKLSLNYSRDVTGGSGFAPGAIRDVIFGSCEKKLTRALSWNGTTGFARNSTGISSTDFKTLFVATGISHPIGRYALLSVGYSGQKQTSKSAAANLTTNSVVASFVWRFRPIRLQ